MASVCRDSRFTELHISDGTDNDPFLTQLTCKMIHDIITLIYLCSLDTVIIITAITLKS